jgi:hypothetical protein
MHSIFGPAQQPAMDLEVFPQMPRQQQRLQRATAIARVSRQYRRKGRCVAHHQTVFLSENAAAGSAPGSIGIGHPDATAATVVPSEAWPLACELPN